MLVYGHHLGPSDREEIERDPKHQPHVVEPERGQPEAVAEPRLSGRDVAQTEIDEADRQFAERPEQRGKGEVEREEGPVLVIVDLWRVQRASAECTGAAEV